MTTEDLHAPVLPGAGASDYERYLRTDELLSLQKTEEERVHHDELLFQTVHQSSELWLKFATTEVDKAAAAPRAGRARARHQAAAPRGAGDAIRHHPDRDAQPDGPVGVPADPRRARARIGVRLARVPPRAEGHPARVQGVRPPARGRRPGANGPVSPRPRARGPLPGRRAADRMGRAHLGVALSPLLDRRAGARRGDRSVRRARRCRCSAS